MFWRCPACRSEIRHNLADVRPAPHTRYRCHVCRLDLRFDPVTEQMEVAPSTPRMPSICVPPTNA